MQPEIPSWKVKLRASRIAALAALTPAEAAQRAADAAAARAERGERRAARAAQALHINQRIVLGDKPEEFAEHLGVTVDAVRKRARRWGHALMQRSGFRRLSAWVADRHVRALDALASDAGLSREKVLEEILAALLGDAIAARRIVTPVKRSAAA